MTPYFRITIVALLIIAGSMAAFVTSAQETRVATITITRPTKYVDGTDIGAGVAITYDVYQGAKGSAKTKVGSITETGLTINTGLQPGETCWQVVAVANARESEPSAEGCKTFQFPATEKVIITVT